MAIRIEDQEDHEAETILNIRLK